jgi:GNAT superfamily N-acetyltransferase
MAIWEYNIVEPWPRTTEKDMEQEPLEQKAIIRPATREDLPRIVVMRDTLNNLELQGSPHAPIQRFSLEEFTAVWGATLEDPTHCWRLVEVDSEVVGFGLIYLLSKTRLPGAFIHWAYVDAQYRRTGLGQQLLDHLLTWAREQGSTRVELQFIDNNRVAENFWSKMGFQPYARKCVHYF